MVATKPQVLLGGLVLPEGPRWRDNKLFFSDMYGSKRVMTVDRNGHSETLAQFENDRPSGLGFLPDGTVLVAMRDSRRIMRLNGGAPRLHGDLRRLPGALLNDMIVDGRGRAYVDSYGSMQSGDMGGDYIVLIEPDGSWRIATAEVKRPNGLLLTPDGKRLIATNSGKLVAFTVEADGSLTNPQLFATTPADGICLDAEGAVWIGTVTHGEFRRIREGGEILERIPVDPGKWAVACVLGGPDRRTLFMCTSRTTVEQLHDHDGKGAQGFIETARVDVAGVGWP